MPKPTIDLARHGQVHRAADAALAKFQAGDFAGALEITGAMLPLIEMFRPELCFTALSQLHAAAALEMSAPLVGAGKYPEARALLTAAAEKLSRWSEAAEMVKTGLAAVETTRSAEERLSRPPWDLPIRRQSFNFDHVAEA